MAACSICRRPLDVASDPLSRDCGGDCWGCIGALEYSPDGGGWPKTNAAVAAEIAQGLREPDGRAKPPPSPDAVA